MGILKKIWYRWKNIAHKIGDFQARLLLSAFYFAIIVPIGLVVKTSDPLGLKKKTTPLWKSYEDLPGNLESFRRQF